MSSSVIKNTLSSDEDNKEMPKRRAAFRSGILKHTGHIASHRLFNLLASSSSLSRPNVSLFPLLLQSRFFPNPPGPLVLNLETSKDLDGILTSYFISNSLSHLLYNLISKQQGFTLLLFCIIIIACVMWHMGS